MGINLINKVRITGIFLWFVLLTFLVGTAFYSNMIYPSFPFRDSSVFQYMGKVISKGDVPYRDSFDHKGPLVYLYNYVGQLININGIWVIELTSMFIAIILTYLILRRFCSILNSLFGTTIVFLLLYRLMSGGNRVEEYSLPFVIGSLLIFLDYFLNGIINRRRLILCGLCFSAVLLLRPNLIALWVVFCIAVLIDSIRKSDCRIGYFLLWFLVGMAILIIPVVVYFGCNHSLKDFWEQYLIFNFHYTATKEVNFPSSVLFFLLMPRFILSGLVLIIFTFIRNKHRKIALIGLIYFGVNIIFISIGCRPLVYYGINLLPCIIIPIAVLLDMLEKKVDIILLSSSLLIVVVVLFFSWMIDAMYVTLPDTTVEYQLSMMIKENTSSDDTIIACVNADMFYVYSDRMAASKYSYQIPIAEIDNSIYDKFKNDITEKKPAVIVTNMNDFDGRYHLEDLSALINDYIKEYNYIKWGTVGYYTLYWRDSVKMPHSSPKDFSSFKGRKY